MEKNHSIITISQSLQYESDKSTYTERCTYFDIGWYIVTASASVWKLIYVSQNNFSDSFMFIALFVVPICIKHIFSFDIYKDMRSNKNATLFFKVLNHISNYALYASFLSLVFLALISDSFIYNNFIKKLFIIIHIIIGMIGIYDRIVVRINPKFNDREGDEND